MSGDVIAGEAVGGGSQCHNRYIRKFRLQRTQLGVYFAEIVAPLRYAVGFVDGKQADIEARQPLVDVGNQALGREVNDFDASGVGGVDIGAIVEVGAVGIDCHRGNPIGHKCLHLVLHQRNERRHHHHATIIQKGRHLIADGFAAAGGHNHHGIASGAYSLDYLELSGAKGVVAVEFFEQRQGARFELC